MIPALHYKTKQFFFFIIKLSIVVGASYFIYNKIANNEHLDFGVFIDFLTENGLFSTKNIIFLVFLTIFNWFFEILKWQNLVNSIKKISFYDALKQSLASLTASLFTPNRIGDYAAKLMYFPKPFRKRVLLLNLIAHMAQMGATVIFGLAGLILFCTKYDLDISYYRVGRFAVIIVIVFIFTLFGIKQDKLRLKGYSLTRILEFGKKLSVQLHLKTLLYSCLRYLIFSFQFYFLLNLFGVDVAYFNAMIVITTMYLLSSIIPSIFLFDVVIKGSVALFLFEIAGVNNLTVLCIITLMWILNFVIPSIFGSFFVMNFRRYKSLDAMT
ncbi:MAG: hypothetical protein HKN54_05105 [Flavobacteriaceae bacterium]|nr:hypothetical protein [Flavobacteriaceae bacterium]